MAQLDLVEVANSNLIRVREKLEAAKLRRDETDAALNDLILSDVSDQKMDRAKADRVAASTDLETMIRAVAEAESRLELAQRDQELARIRGAEDRIRKKSAKRNSILSEAEEHFVAFLDKLALADQLAVEIHADAAGAREVGTALNDRFKRLGGWVTTRFYERFPHPEMDAAIGSAIANHTHARQQMNGKSLADLDADFAALYRAHHEKKAETGNDQAA